MLPVLVWAGVDETVRHGIHQGFLELHRLATVWSLLVRIYPQVDHPVPVGLIPWDFVLSYHSVPFNLQDDVLCQNLRWWCRDHDPNLRDNRWPDPVRYHLPRPPVCPLQDLLGAPHGCQRPKRTVRRHREPPRSTLHADYQAFLRRQDPTNIGLEHGYSPQGRQHTIPVHPLPRGSLGTPAGLQRSVRSLCCC